MVILLAYDVWCYGTENSFLKFNNNMLKKKHFGYIIFSLAIIYLYVFIIPSDNKTNCSNKKEFLAYVFKGVVIRKYLDKEQHSYPMIDIINFIDNKKFQINLVEESSNIFEKVLVDDTIMKNKGSDILKFIRNDSSFSLRAYFNCDSIKNSNIH